MSYNRRFALKMFFGEIIRLSHTTDMLAEAIVGGGYPLSGLVNSLLSHRTLIDRMVDDATGESHEFRLNDAGFKLYWRLDQKHNLLKIRFGGDQMKDYPMFSARIRLTMRWSNIR